MKSYNIYQCVGRAYVCKHDTTMHMLAHHIAGHMTSYSVIHICIKCESSSLQETNVTGLNRVR